MKKVLSFVLVLAMILGSVSMAFATVSVAAVTKDNTVVPFPDAEDSGVATVLRDLGALKGNEAGLVNLKGTLSRAEAATIVVRALGLEDLGKVPTATKFKDVAKDAWYSGYVAQAAAVGAMKGQSATTFAPEANITLDECVALVAQTLGYDAAHLAGSWPANYRNVARQVGFLGKVAVGTADATRADLINLIYNALDCSKVEWIEKLEGGYVGANQDNQVQYTFAGETLFEAISGLGNKSLDDVYTHAALGVGAGTVVTAETPFGNGFDASAFYGKKVVYLQKYETTSKTWENIGIWGVDTTTLVGKFVYKRGTKTIEKFELADGTTYKFDLDNDGTTAVFTSTDALSFSTDVQFYDNGVSVAAARMTDTRALDNTTEYEISVEFNDAKTAITTFGSISFWRVNNVAIVNATQAALLADMDVVTLNDEEPLVDDLVFATTAVAVGSAKMKYLANSCKVEGAVDSLDKIEEDDVLEIYTAPTANTTIVKVVVTRNKVVGTISAYDGKNTVTVNGKAYKVASVTVAAFESLGTIKATSEFAFYLDSAGKYVYGKLNKEAVKPQYSYAFVTGYKPVKADQGEKVKEDVTYASIWLTVPGEDEVLYNTVKVLTAGNVHSDANLEKYDPAFAKASNAGYALVKVDVSTGELKYLEGKVVTGGAAGITVYKSGVINGYKITDATKIYKVVSTGATEIVKDTNYKVLAFSDIVDRKFTAGDLLYVEGANNVIDVVVVKGEATLTGEQTKVTGAAYVTKTYNTATKKYDVTFITVDGNITVAETANTTYVVGELYNFAIAGGEIVGNPLSVTASKVLVADGKANIQNAKLTSTVLKASGASLYVSADAKVWKLDKSAAVKVYEEADFYTAIADLLVDKLYVVDLNSDSEYDLILVETSAN